MTSFCTGWKAFCSANGSKMLVGSRMIRRIALTNVRTFSCSGWIRVPAANDLQINHEILRVLKSEQGENVKDSSFTDKRLIFPSTEENNNSNGNQRKSTLKKKITPQDQVSMKDILKEEALAKLEKLKINRTPKKAVAKKSIPTKKLKQNLHTAIEKKDDYNLTRPRRAVMPFNSVKGQPILREYDTISDYKSVNVKQKGEVPPLEHNLSRVLFTPGPQFLQDPRSKVFNFDPYLQKIIKVDEFNFDLIPKYITSSKDQIMLGVCRELKKKYFSSTSSMTGLLSHIHFFLSNFRPSYLGDFSKNITDEMAPPTKSAKLPASVIVRYIDGQYAIDADKSADTEIVLSRLGHILEKLLTSKPEVFDAHKLEAATSDLETPDKETSCYHYADVSSFVLRSQLDCKDSRLPGNGTFDLKTRAVCAVRHDMRKNEEEVTGYEIIKKTGLYESFERELFELSKSTLLKYLLQARIGNMDGIFLAYHNIARMFGFEYLSMAQMDKMIHGFGDWNKPISFEAYNRNPSISDEFDKLATMTGEGEFTISIKLLNDILNLITTEHIKNQSFRLVLEAVQITEFDTKLRVYASPVTSEQIETIQTSGFKPSELIEGTNESIELKSHISKIKEINKTTTENAIGFEVLVQHFLNHRPSKMKHPRPLGTDDSWRVKVKISEMKQNKSGNNVQSSMNLALSCKINMLANHDLKNDEEAGFYIKFLRKLGQKGTLHRSQFDKGEKPVWNRDN